MVDRRHPGALLSRRQFLGCAAAASATLLADCQNPGPPGPDCDPPNVSGVDWIPDVAHPVAWGEERLTTDDGAPRTLSVYYPSPRFIPPRPMLRSCLGRWPVVLFLHGQLPGGLSPAARDGYHRAWWRAPVALARSGYVVVVPRHSGLLPQREEAPAMVAEAMRDVERCARSGTRRSGSPRASARPPSQATVSAPCSPRGSPRRIPRSPPSSAWAAASTSS